MKNVLLYVLFIIVLVFSNFTQAKEKARPQSIGGDYLIELTMGAVDEGEETALELGLEVERFIDTLAHHCAVGLVFETSFSEEKEFYYTALSASAYYYHYKIYLSSGLSSDFDRINEWKTRVGFGKEFFLAHNYLLVPALTLDHVRGYFNPGFSVGLAHEF